MKIRNILNKNITIGGITAVILLITTFAFAKDTFAMPPRAVGLIDFTATPQNNAALLEWETATELGAAGFSIQRRLASEGVENYIDVLDFINAVGDVTAGAEYSYLDGTAVNGQTYIYQLSEIETSGATEALDETEVTIGVQPTATPVTIGGGGNTNPTPTPVTTNATATPRATARAGEPTATAVSATIVPTGRATAVATTSSISRPTATTVHTLPTATIASSTNSTTDNTVVFAQGNTPTAYPAEGIIATQPAANTDYPASAEQIVNETATPYPAVTIQSSVGVDDGYDSADNGATVIGGNADSGTTAVRTDESHDSSTGYLWAGFLIAAFIFVMGLIGTAVFLTRKK